jgi:hypothetical protein
MKNAATLTERQQKWFATVEANFEKATGRPVAVWVDILKGCPETRPKAQAAWLKATHGIGANHAAHILNAARPDDAMGWDDAEALRAALWSEPRSLAILEAIERAAANVDGVIPGQRKGYTAFSRAVQFAATRPLKGGRALLGLKLDPASSPRLSEAGRKESWSERLTAVIELDGPGAVDAEIGRLFAQAAESG